jgi:Na+-driven multidrug efflux pump
VINVVLNFWWIPKFGALGSAWASSVSYSIGAIIFAVVYARMSHLTLADLFIPTLADLRRLRPFQFLNDPKSAAHDK